MLFKQNFHDDTTDYDQILSAVKEHFDKEKHMGDDTWYYDALHEEIDAYVVRYDYEAKKIVLKYGVFEAICICDETYGEFEIDKKDYDRNYLKLYYLIIEEVMMDNFKQELEDMANEDKQMKKRIEEQFKMIEELKKENEELKKKVAELTPAPTPRKIEDPVNEIKEEPKKKEYRCPCGAVLSDNSKWYITNHEKRSKAHIRWVEANKK